MTPPPGSEPSGDGAWASRLTARPAARPASRRASRRAFARPASLAGGRLRRLNEHVAARFAVPPRAVLGLVVLSVVVLAVLGVRLVLAGREVAATPVVPAVAAPSADVRPGAAVVASASGAPDVRGVP